MVGSNGIEEDRKERPRNSDFGEEEGSKTLAESNFTFRDSDAGANQDLRLKIVNKSHSSSGADRDGEDRVVLRESAVADPSGEVQSVSVDVVMEGDDTEAIIGCEVDKLSEQNADDNSDNVVLRRLLRGPRYFDPPDSNWGTFYNCGEEGHSAAKCKSAKRKKPCFVCGSFMHGAKQCHKGRDCFTCNQSGHIAKDCPKKLKGSFLGSDLCLKCGYHGHVMLSCTNDYSSDDLKEIQCYICKDFGHLSCANYFWNVPSEVSCYKCGQLGHTGLACRGSQGEKAGKRTPSSCFKCGQEGHFSRECNSIVKAKKRNRDLSTPKKKASREGKVSKGYKSAPRDPSKARKKRKLQWDEKAEVSSSKRKVRGGWIMDDLGDFSPGKYTLNRGWQSPSTQNANKYRTPPSWSTKRNASSSSSPKRHNSSYERSNSHYGNTRSPYGRTPNSQSSRNSFQHGYSASRFGNPSTGGLRKENNWW